MRSWILVIALAACAGGPKSSTLPSRSGEGLWRLAPARARIGVVVQGGALPELVAALDRWISLVEMFPLGQPAIRELRAAQQKAGLERFDRDTLLARTGLDLARPFALFAGDQGRSEVLFVLPVADRATWRRFAQAKVEGDRDRLGNLACAGDTTLYLCAMDEAALRAALAGPKDSPLAARHARVPADVHGEIEVVVDPGDTFDGPGPPGLVAPTVIAASLSLDDHGLLAQLWSDIRLEGELAAAAARPLPRELLPLLGGASGVARLLLPRVLLDQALEGQAGPAAAVFELVTGEVLWVTRGRELAGGSLYLFVRDEAAAARLLEQACRARQDLRWTAGRCEMDYPAAFGLPGGTVVARVAGGAWVLGLGDPGPGDQAPAVGGEPARRIIEGPAHLAVWGLGLDLLAGLPDELRARLPDLLPTKLRRLLPAVELASFLAASVYEAGLRVAQDGRGLRIDLVVTTFAGEPAAARAAHADALRLRARGDFTGYRAAMAAIAAKYPGSLLARQARELEGRGPVIGLSGMALVGFTAAIAASAFEKYEARVHGELPRAYLRQLAALVEAYHAAHGRLPAGSAQSGARGSCCTQACVVEGGLWQELGFLPETSVYTFEYEPLGDEFRVRAVADRDCDGELSIFETGGRISEEGGGLLVSPEIYDTQPLE